MKLVVFDVDGTLTATAGIDVRCFTQAFADEFDIAEINPDWDAYPSVTDSCVTIEVLRTALGREPNQKEITRHKTRFVRLLKTALHTDEEQSSEVPGAGALLELLRKESGWGIAIATGGWRESAMEKLAKATLHVSDLPLAAADDGLSREEIVRAAITRAGSTYGQKKFEGVVSVGDALWDLRTARALGIGFVAVATGRRASSLQEHGAQHVVKDFRNPELFLSLLDRANSVS
jgi:phosphoglycolate phosphatase-like HAD superfamily hydrolase